MLGSSADWVATCPKGFWEKWIAEGDAAGDPETGETWAWFTRDPQAARVQPGSRFYIVAHGTLRGWAPVVRVRLTLDGWAICRRGDAVACTIAEPIRGFRGLRRCWWAREDELPFPDWRTP